MLQGTCRVTAAYNLNSLSKLKTLIESIPKTYSQESLIKVFQKQSDKYSVLRPSVFIFVEAAVSLSTID